MNVLNATDCSLKKAQFNPMRISPQLENKEYKTGGRKLVAILGENIEHDLIINI